MGVPAPSRVLIAAHNRSLAGFMRIAIQQLGQQSDKTLIGIADPMERGWQDRWRGQFDVVIFAADELLTLVRRRRLRLDDFAEQTVMALVASELEFVDLLRLGGQVHAIMLESHGIDQVDAVIDLAISGYSILPQAAVRYVTEDRMRLDLLDSLTEEERAALELLAGVRSNREIARAMRLPEARTKTLVRSVLAKLRLRNRTSAAVFAVRHNLARRFAEDDERVSMFSP